MLVQLRIRLYSGQVLTSGVNDPGLTADHSSFLPHVLSYELPVDYTRRRGISCFKSQEERFFTMSDSAINSEVLSKYVGGQLEVQNRSEGYLYRGEIAAVDFQGEGGDQRLTVTLAWLAKMEAGRWVVTENQPWIASLPLYSANQIDAERLLMNSPLTGDLAVFFPPGGSTLARTRVEGLDSCP